MIPRRLPRLLSGPSSSARADVDDELRFHIDMAAADLVASGVEPAAARAEAERRFGAYPDVRGAVLTIAERRRRRASTSHAMRAFLFDLRLGLRSLRRTPMLTVVGSLTLMLGIGATTAIFSVVDGVLLRPLPYPNANRLVSLGNVQADGGTAPLAYPEYLDWQQRGTQVFDDIAVWFPTSMALTGVAQPVILQGQRVSSSLPRLLGVKPLLGRAFRPEEDGVTGDRVIMVSENLWHRQFNADSGVIGRTLELAGYPFVVVGVYPTSTSTRLPTELTSVRHSDYWQPLRLDITRAPRDLNFMAGIARLRPGVSLAAAAPRIKQVNDQLHRDSVTTQSLTARSLADQALGPSRGLLGAIFGAVVLVLLVACANVANLLLAHAAARQREIAVRTALGASRGRIVAQLLGESVLRAVLGGVLGIGLAYASVTLLHRSLAVRLPRFADVTIDGGALAFAIAVSALTGIVFGLVPALRSARTDANTVMREGGRGVAGSLKRDAVRRALIVGEIVMSFVLLVGAGLLVRSFDRLMNVPRGFDSDHLLSASVSLSRARYPDSSREIAFHRQLLERVHAIPGVTGAAVTSDLPIQGGTNGGIEIEGRTYPRGQSPVVEKRFASAGYFATIGARIASGRDFATTDLMNTPHVAIVNQAFADRLFPGENAIGKRVDFAFNTLGLQTIVGVVANVKEQALDAPVTPAIYLPEEQRTSEFMYLIVRSSASPASLVPAIRRELRAIDPNTPLDNVITIDDVIAGGVSTQRVTTLLLTIFSAAALLLAGIGLYGVISYSVVQRTQELGIRSALGAQRREIVGSVMREGLAFVAAGTVLGIVAARASTRVIAAQLFGVTANDPMVYAVVTVLLVAVSVVALLAPALRAAHVDPIIALRDQ